MIENLEIVQLIRSSRVLYGATNGAHILGLALLVGTIINVDLRIIGIWRGESWRAAMRDSLPLAWVGFALAAITGALLASVKLSRYLDNPAFLLKMGLLALALLNIALFHYVLKKSERTVRMRLSAALSLTLWISILGAGRAIGFV